MRPILFQWRAFTVWSYPAMLYLGLVAGIVAGNLAAHAAGLDAFRVFVATLILIVPALIGARLLFVATHWTHYQNRPGRIWNRQEGGLAMYGGLPIMLLLSVLVLHALRLEFGAFWDVAVFTILAGMIFARMGCLMNGCCAGRPSRMRLSVYLPNPKGVWQRRIPTQVLEAAWAAALLISAIVVWRWRPFPGALFWFVSAGYASGRFVLESTRESDPGSRRFTIHHAISVLMIVLSLSALTARWPK